MTVKTFAVLGPMEVHTEQGQVALGGIRNRSILAALLLEADRVVPIGRLIDAAWGESPPGSARAQVQNRVGLLRRLLPAAHPGGLIATTGSGYRLELGGGELDLRRFDEEICRADTLAAGGHPAPASTALTGALGMWRGPALDGLTTPLLQAAAVHLEERRLNALERRIQLDLDLGRHGQLVPELTDLTGEHPYRESLHALLTLALYRSGRRAEALHAHQRVRQLLCEQLGVEPGERLRELHDAMLRGDDSLMPQPAVSASTRISRPPAAVPRELPAQAGRFTGREQALAELDLLLPDAAETGAPVVISAIAGTAGVGKTALAVHWAHRVAHLFPDGQLCINLHGYAPGPPMRPIEALELLLRSLGVRPEQVPMDVTGAAAMYRSLLAGKRVLVVLDNARSAEEVRPLLPGGPGCLVLITSRDRLTGLVARDGVRRLTLSVFTPEEAGTLLARLLGADRVRAEPEAVVELAGLCAYLPLALRIAAAILTHRPYRSVADLVAELRTTNHLGALAADDDHETAIQVAFDLSYQTISPAAQRLFRLLGLIPGDDFSAAAAAALSGMGLAEVRPLLDRLAAAHLIEERAPDRFAFHDLLRRYAGDRATAQHSPAERAQALDGLYGWYLAGVDAAARELYPLTLRLPAPDGDRPGAGPPRGRTRRLAWLNAERPNLLAAIHHAAAHGPHPAAWLLTDWLRGYLWRRGHLAEWSGASQVALAATEEAGDLSGQAAVRHTLGLVNTCLGNHDEAITHLTAAIDLSARAGWSTGRIAMMGTLGNLYCEMGRTRQAVHLYHEVLERAQHQRDPQQGVYLNNIGYVYRVLGRLREALAYLTRAEALFRAAGEFQSEANTLDSLATTYHELGRLTEALDHGTRSVAQHREVGHPEKAARAMTNLASIQADLGRHGQALELAEESLRLARTIGERRAELYALNAVAAVHAAHGDPAAAARRYEQVRRGTGDLPYPRTVATIGLAGAYARLGRHNAAVAYAQEARQAAGEYGFAVLESLALTALADALARAGKPQAAVAHARTALDGHQRSGHRLGEAHTLALLGRLSGGAGGIRLRQRADDLYAEIGVPVPADSRERAVC